MKPSLNLDRRGCAAANRRRSEGEANAMKYRLSRQRAEKLRQIGDAHGIQSVVVTGKRESR